MKTSQILSINDDVHTAILTKLPKRKLSAYTEFLYKCIINGRLQIIETAEGLKLELINKDG